MSIQLRFMPRRGRNGSSDKVSESYVPLSEKCETHFYHSLQLRRTLRWTYFGSGKASGSGRENLLDRTYHRRKPRPSATIVICILPLSLFTFYRDQAHDKYGSVPNEKHRLVRNGRRQACLLGRRAVLKSSAALSRTSLTNVHTHGGKYFCYNGPKEWIRLPNNISTRLTMWTFPPKMRHQVFFLVDVPGEKSPRMHRFGHPLSLDGDPSPWAQPPPVDRHSKIRVARERHQWSNCPVQAWRVHEHTQY
ncbi:hypothetical protein EDD16DRAFT_1727413 [Pisolithus croceorrhizus]|nr:hypothetical protein EDD16DRAFT_1727413 [Pisolithus croceorrhizus]